MKFDNFKKEIMSQSSYLQIPTISGGIRVDLEGETGILENA